MRFPVRWSMIGILVLVWLACIDTASAQEHHTKSAAELFAATGWVGWLLVGVSVCGVALTIEHFVNLRADVLAPPETLDELETLIEENNCEEAIEVCDNNEGFITTLVGAALRLR